MREPSESSGRGLKTYHGTHLVGCAFGKHYTWRPTGRGAEHMLGELYACIAGVEHWKCLRCGLFVPGAPRHTSLATEPPHVARGKELRQEWIIRFLAAERAVRVVLLLSVALVLWKFKHAQDTLQVLFGKDIPILSATAGHVHSGLESGALNEVAKLMQRLGGMSQHEINILLVVVLVYALAEAIEAVGLWTMSRIGEYFAVIVTSAFIPFEIWELTVHASGFKIGALLVNVAAVVWLIYTKRLFSLRGGHEALMRSLRSASLVPVLPAAAPA